MSRNEHIYLDWNATAPMRAEAVDAMRDAAVNWANPSSVHAPGRGARGALETAREEIAAGLGALPDQLIFTSGGTEAASLAMQGVAADRRFVSEIEHSAVLAAAPDAARVPVNANGTVDLRALEALLDGRPALVGVMHANNETGAIQPIAQIYELVNATGGKLFVDAVQTAGKMPLPPADFLAVSAHKLGGPPGTGALIARCATGLSALQKGGGQERGQRGGTENLPGIAGFAAAVSACRRGWLNDAAARRDRLETRLRAAGAHVFAADAERLPTTSMIRMPGAQAAMQLIHFDMAGIAVSSGAACSSGKVAASHVLRAMGIAEAEAAEAIRVSTGWSTTDAHVDAFCDIWERLAARRKAA
ncbi:cysteine desulfurase family protein [Pacificimonas pallii]|uniref:cysteine desulfurase family protein n=1 Tax=Pacificimonas pallii TaxID=2827236 RepID=UPI00210241B9|nr:cysteine desulfurase family protein [Pacificimonas pallii]